jgi:hypothetical protein
MALVNSPRLPTTPLEKFCTPPTTEAAKADPGKEGIERPPCPPPDGWLTVVGPEEMVEGRKVGS